MDASEDRNAQLLDSLEAHLALIEGQLESIIRVVSILPPRSNRNTGILQATFKKKLG